MQDDIQMTDFTKISEFIGRAIYFLVIISIAVSLEALVFIFDAARKDISLLIYPTLLLVAMVLLVVGLGIFHRLHQPAKE